LAKVAALRGTNTMHQQPCDVLHPGPVWKTLFPVAARNPYDLPAQWHLPAHVAARNLSVMVKALLPDLTTFVRSAASCLDRIVLGKADPDVKLVVPMADRVVPVGGSIELAIKVE
jgi:hypothetical protein